MALQELRGGETNFEKEMTMKKDLMSHRTDVKVLTEKRAELDKAIKSKHAEVVKRGLIIRDLKRRIDELSKSEKQKRREAAKSSNRIDTKENGDVEENFERLPNIPCPEEEDFERGRRMIRDIEEQKETAKIEFEVDIQRIKDMQKELKMDHQELQAMINSKNKQLRNITLRLNYLKRLNRYRDGQKPSNEEDKLTVFTEQPQKAGSKRRGDPKYSHKDSGNHSGIDMDHELFGDKDFNESHNIIHKRYRSNNHSPLTEKAGFDQMDFTPSQPRQKQTLADLKNKYIEQGKTMPKRLEPETSKKSIPEPSFQKPKPEDKPPTKPKPSENKLITLLNKPQPTQPSSLQNKPKPVNQSDNPSPSNPDTGRKSLGPPPIPIIVSTAKPKEGDKPSNQIILATATTATLPTTKKDKEPDVVEQKLHSPSAAREASEKTFPIVDEHSKAKDANGAEKGKLKGANGKKKAKEDDFDDFFEEKPKVGDDKKGADVRAPQDKLPIHSAQDQKQKNTSGSDQMQMTSPVIQGRSKPDESKTAINSKPNLRPALPKPALEEKQKEAEQKVPTTNHLKEKDDKEPHHQDLDLIRPSRVQNGDTEVKVGNKTGLESKPNELYKSGTQKSDGQSLNSQPKPVGDSKKVENPSKLPSVPITLSESSHPVLKPATINPKAQADLANLTAKSSPQPLGIPAPKQPKEATKHSIVKPTTFDEDEDMEDWNDLVPAEKKKLGDPMVISKVEDLPNLESKKSLGRSDKNSTPLVVPMQEKKPTVLPTPIQPVQSKPVIQPNTKAPIQEPPKPSQTLTNKNAVSKAQENDDFDLDFDDKPPVKTKPAEPPKPAPATTSSYKPMVQEPPGLPLGNPLALPPSLQTKTFVLKKKDPPTAPIAPPPPPPRPITPKGRQITEGDYGEYDPALFND